MSAPVHYDYDEASPFLPEILRERRPNRELNACVSGGGSVVSFLAAHADPDRAARTRKALADATASMERTAAAMRGQQKEAAE